jgi:hypothetical protein
MHLKSRGWNFENVSIVFFYKFMSNPIKGYGLFANFENFNFGIAKFLEILFKKKLSFTCVCCSVTWTLKRKQWDVGSSI